MPLHADEGWALKRFKHDVLCTQQMIVLDEGFCPLQNIHGNAPFRNGTVMEGPIQCCAMSCDSKIAVSLVWLFYGNQLHVSTGR
jgi:hypothetical protein